MAQGRAQGKGETFRSKQEVDVMRVSGDETTATVQEPVYGVRLSQAVARAAALVAAMPVGPQRAVAQAYLMSAERRTAAGSYAAALSDLERAVGVATARLPGRE